MVNTIKSMKQKLSKKQIALAIAAGVAVGFVNGFLGAGGGMLVVPLLRLIFQQQPKVAHSTAVLVILPICVISSIVYLVGGEIDINVLWPVALGTLIGGFAGTFLLSKLRNNIVTVLFSLLMFGAGCFMIFTAF